MIVPLSCCGKNPFGTMTNRKMFTAIVSKRTISVIAGCRSTTRRLRSYAPSSFRKTFFAQRDKASPCSSGLRCRSKREHIIGVVVSETTSETRMAVESTTANSRNKRPTMPPISNIGMKTATSERLMESTVKPTSRAPRSAACHRRHAFFQMARHVFDDDNRVIHDEAGGNRQRHQRKIVHAVIEQIHHAKRADQRNRDDDGGNQRRARAAQENKHDQNHQRDGDEQGAFDFADRRANRRRAVEHHVAS